MGREDLEPVKNSKDHMHLIIDSEINYFPIAEKMKGVTTYAKQVLLQFNESESWNKGVRADYNLKKHTTYE